MHHDAVIVARVILRLCGEVDAPVFPGKPPPVAIGYTPPHLMRRTYDVFPMSLSRFKRSNSESHHVQGSTTWQEQRWVLESCICRTPLRDEVYIQLVSRLSTEAPITSRLPAWQFLGVLLSSLAPVDTTLADALAALIEECSNSVKEHESIRTIAKHCRGRLAGILQRGTSVLTPSTPEIQGAWEAAFQPTVFGQTLEAVMQAQSQMLPNAEIPLVFTFLGDALLLLDGLSTPNIFRRVGDVEQQTQLRLRIDRGYYSLTGIADSQEKSSNRRSALVVAATLKLFLKELAEPLIPSDLYDECTAASSSADAGRCVSIVKTRLSPLRRRCLLYIIALLQQFCRPEVVKVTGIDAVELASLFSPTLFRRTASNSASRNNKTMVHAGYESMFVHALLMSLPVQSVDPDYVPEIVDPKRKVTAARFLASASTTAGKSNAKG